MSSAAAPAVAAPLLTSRLDAENPWPALASFEQGDAPFFHGRDAAIASLLQLVAREDVVLLYGSSGLGKTSLIRAGVFPRVPATLLPVYVRLRFETAGASADDPGELRNQVLDAVRAEAEKWSVELPPEAPSDTLWEYFRRRDLPCWRGNQIVTPLLVFDQFEQLFTRNASNSLPQPIIDTFFDDLGCLLHGRIPGWLGARPDPVDGPHRYIFESSACKAIFSFREEFLADVKRVRTVITSTDRNSFRLEPMRWTDAVTAIRRAGGHLLSPLPEGAREGDRADVAAAIATIVSGQPEETENATVEPAILSVFCDELNEERKARASKGGPPVIDLTLVRNREASEIIARFYRRAVAEAPDAVRRIIEEELVLPPRQPGEPGTRNSVAFEQVPEPARPAVETLVNKWRILRLEVVGRQKQARLELTHDVLVRPALEDRRVRVERAARSRERRVGGLVAVVLLVILTVSVAFKKLSDTREARQQAESRLLDRTVTDAIDVTRAGNTGEGLAELASLLRLHPDNTSLRSLTLDLLLRRSWLLPVSETAASGKGHALWSAFSPDGRLSVTTWEKGFARLWRPATGETMADLDLQGDVEVWAAAFSHDGRSVVTVGSAGAVVWEVPSGRQVGRLSHGSVMYGAEFSPDGQRVITASNDNSAIVWRSGTWSQAMVLPHRRQVFAARFGPDGGKIVTASLDGTARVWDATTGRPLHELLHADAVLGAAFSPDGQWIATAPVRGNVRLWRASTGGLVRELPRSRPVTSVEFSPDGLRLLTVEDIVVRVWEVARFSMPNEVPSLDLQHAGSVRSASFSPDARFVLTAAADGRARTWDIASGGRLVTSLNHPSPLSSARFGPTAQQILTATEDGRGMAWQSESVASQPLVLEPRAPATASPLDPPSAQPAAFSGENDDEVITGAGDGTASVWNAGRGVEQETLGVPSGGKVLVEAGKDDRLVTAHVSAAGGATAYAWKRVGGRWIEQKHLDVSGGITSVHFDPAGARVAISSQDGFVRIWPIDGGAPLTSKTKHALASATVAFSRDGRYVVSTSYDGTARVWDASTGDLIGGPLKHEGAVVSARFDAAGRRVLTASADGKAAIWTIGKAPTAVWLDHGAPVVWAQWSLEDTRVVTAAGDGTVRIWSAAGDPIARSRVHGAGVGAGALSRDGARIATGAIDGTVRVLDAGSIQPQCDVLNVGSAVNSIRFDSSGTRLLVASNDGVVRLFDLPRGAPADARWLATMAEQLGGMHEVNGALEPVPDWVAQVAALRKRLQGSVDKGDASLEQRIGRWFFAGPEAKTLSPFTTKRVARESLGGTPP